MSKAHERRMAELEKLGIKPNHAGVQGSVALYATDLERLMQHIRRQDKRIDTQRRVLAIIETWASFRGGEMLDAEHVVQLLERTRKDCE